MTTRLAARCRQLGRYGHSFRTIAAPVSTPERAISDTTVAALGRLDLWGMFRQLAATISGPTRWCGWGPETLAAIVCGFALRFRSIEDLKNAQRADLGVLLGTAQAPTVLVLCQKIQDLGRSRPRRPPWHAQSRTASSPRRWPDPPLHPRRTT